MLDIMKCKWRVGRLDGNVIYAQIFDEPGDEDIDIGAMNSEEMAKHVVELHNATL